MTRSEWLNIGYSNNIIDMVEYEEISFKSAYKKWFLMKLRQNKPQSCDRIEVTYNRYYADDVFIEKCISKITEQDIIDFLSKCIVESGTMSAKEYGRCVQIVNNVLVYFRDLGLGGVRLFDWNRIKRCLPLESLNTMNEQKEYAIAIRDVRKLFNMVIDDKVYYLKQDACLCLCMNFYLGLRIGELASLCFDDFDFERGVVKIHSTETKSYNRNADGEKCGSMVYKISCSTKTISGIREIPILPEVKYIYELIVAQHHLQGYHSPYLCYDGKDAILVRSLDRCLRRLCTLCDIEYFNSHAIRKMFGTMLHYNNVPTRVISDLMGHSEMCTTERCYILSFGNDYKNIYNLMKGALTYV